MPEYVTRMNSAYTAPKHRTGTLTGVRHKLSDAPIEGRGFTLTGTGESVSREPTVRPHSSWSFSPAVAGSPTI